MGAQERGLNAPGLGLKALGLGIEVQEWGKSSGVGIKALASPHPAVL